MSSNYCFLCSHRADMKNLLLIDDDSINNFVNKELIKRKYPDVSMGSFESPLFALNYLNEDSITEPDLILLDLNMPLLNGWEFMEELQKRNKWFKVAILTSSINPQDEERSEAFDMVQGFLVKPIDLDKLAELKAVL